MVGQHVGMTNIPELETAVWASRGHLWNVPHDKMAFVRLYSIVIDGSPISVHLFWSWFDISPRPNSSTGLFHHSQYRKCCQSHKYINDQRIKVVPISPQKAQVIDWLNNPPHFPFNDNIWQPPGIGEHGATRWTDNNGTADTSAAIVETTIEASSRSTTGSERATPTTCSELRRSNGSSGKTRSSHDTWHAQLERLFHCG